MLSRVQLFATPWTVVHQDPLSTEFFREEYWSGLALPTRGDLPHPGCEPVLAGRFFTTAPPRKPLPYHTKSLLNLLQQTLSCFGYIGLQACGILAPWPGIEPLALEGEVLIPLDHQGSSSPTS